MGFFDLLRGFVPSAAQQLARNPWVASTNPPPSWLMDPATAAGPMPLIDRIEAPELFGPMPAWSDESIDNIRQQLLAGALSRIGPERFALNPESSASSLPNSGTPWQTRLQPILEAGAPAFEAGVGPSAPSSAGLAQMQTGTRIADLWATAAGSGAAATNLADRTGDTTRAITPTDPSLITSGVDGGAPFGLMLLSGNQPTSFADAVDGPPSSGDQPQNYAGQIANTIWDAINPFPSADAHESEAPGNIAAALRARVAAGRLSEEEAARIESQFSGLERWNKDAIAARAQIDANRRAENQRRGDQSNTDADRTANGSDAVQEPRGGTYVLRDKGDGTIVRSGHSNDLERRAGEHGRDPDLRDFHFDPIHHTDDYAERRGLEQMLHDSVNPPLNKIKPISPRNDKITDYLEAAWRYLRGGGGQ
jgi:hypothetical protein